MNHEMTMPDPKAASDKRPIYIRLADELSELVESGQLKAGDRLPSVRRLVAQKGVSATTAVAASSHPLSMVRFALIAPCLSSYLRLMRSHINVAGCGARRPHTPGQGLAVP